MPFPKRETSKAAVTVYNFGFLRIADPIANDRSGDARYRGKAADHCSVSGFLHGVGRFAGTQAGVVIGVTDEFVWFQERNKLPRAELHGGVGRQARAVSVTVSGTTGTTDVNG